jgi:Outer membrane protein beta-barrel domain
MKIKILLIATLFSCLSGIYAQKKTWRFGLSMGSNISAFSDQIFKTVDTEVSHFIIPKVLYGGDISTEIHYIFNQHLSLNSGIAYRQKGIRYLGNDAFRVMDFRANYIAIPLQFRYTSEPLFYELGTELAYLHTMRTMADGVEQKGYSIFENPIDALINVGLGIVILERLSLSVRVSNGLIGTANQIETNNNNIVIKTTQYNKNLSLQIALAYYIN